ncbi:AAA family ATPase [Phyllobacterium chamaecytisi]|uniref:AAA family ATPase n=1 Tax=Phyllobacterium chamaecytisi TaxID=2876082 RepID=UPI001CCA0DFD|nr:AAA family ATPase [Phyllobacterium sp. KW56]MBZ9600494.1 AAA family ATPase [Phyllobacterium sp. KW56]
MYLKSIELENSGPIAYLSYQFSFDAEGKPKPVVFVGQNGSGKSVLLSHIVNTMITAKGAAFTDAEVESGKVYKLRSADYILHGANYSRSEVKFQNDLYQSEFQLRLPRGVFEEKLGYTSIDSAWNNLGLKDNTGLASNFHEKADQIKDALLNFSLLYFPANRFEDPAWLNIDNLLNVATYTHHKNIAGVSNRKIINYSPLRDNQNWLLDILYDSFALERTVHSIKVGEPAIMLPVMVEGTGPATKLRQEIERFFLTLFQREGALNWNVGQRGRRQLALIGAGSPIATNLFTLSTGQTGLLNVFLTLIRDYDLSRAQFNSLADVRGIAIIDEVDLHLHTELQHTILPALIALFPKVQFVLTSHSPLFILGLQKVLGNEGFDIIELPSGQLVGVERFSEFEKAYRYFKDSAQFEEDVRSSIVSSQKPVLFVEGSIDVDLLQQAAELLGRRESLDKYRLLDANGYGGLDKIWKHFDSHLAQLMNQRVTLLYDCDVSKSNSSKPGVRRLAMPQQQRRLKKGIENLFPETLIQQAKEEHPKFIDVTPSYEKLVRGSGVMVDEQWEVNPDEKRNLANWILDKATANDFADFSSIFDTIDAA